MFKGIWLKAKTLKAIQDNYSYNPAVPGAQNSTFSECIRFVSKNGGNEHDAAALFMASQCQMLCESPELNVKGRQFIRGNLNMMFATMGQMKCAEVRTLVEDLNDTARRVGA